MSVMSMSRVAAGTVGAALLLFSFAAQAAETKVGDIAIVDAWARATPARAGGVFLTLRNDGASADRLTGVSTPVAPMSAVHETRQQNGVMEMRPVDALDLPPHKTVMLKPGGYHVMLMGLAQPLKQGETFPLTLTFAHAGTATVTVTVKGAGDTGMSMDHMDMSHGSGQ